MENPGARRRRQEWLYRSPLGVFVPTGLVLVTLISFMILTPLYQRQINSRWVAIGDVLEPGRILLGNIQSTHAREMANVRAFALTGDPDFISQNQFLLGEEREFLLEFDRLTLALAPDVIDAYQDFAESVDRWRTRSTREEMLAGILEPSAYIERIASEHALWERLLTTSTLLRNSLLHEETGVREEIIALERARTVTTRALILLAILSAMAAAWMGMQIQRLRLQAEGRGQELNRLMEGRARLIRGITHDVKNPLGVISGYTDLLQGGLLRGAASSDALERVQEASRTALHLIEDLLELSVSEAGQLRLRFEPVDIRETVERAVSEHAAAASRAGLVLTASAPPSLPGVTTDGHRVNQILANLLSNAIKYTPEGGTIQVGVAATRVDGHRPEIRIWIKDSGHGIPAEKLEDIFEEFSRLEAGARRGTGLGLTISRRFARALGGDITVASGRDGSTFTFRLPLHPPGQQ